jgi:hypothetical protein
MMPRLFALLLTSLLFCTELSAETSYQPFVLASINDRGLAEQTETTINALEDAGFQLAGRYAPLPNANVIVVTSPRLQAIAAQTERGGYAAGQRVSVTERGGKTEVSFVNPLYIQYAYRLGEGMEEIHGLLSKTLGNLEAFGTEEGRTAKKLGKYHYTVGMQRFDDPSELASFDSYEAALAAVERGLDRQGDALTQVYRIDLPGKEQTVFGVGMKATGASDDEMDIDEAHQLSIVDFEGYSKVAYYPYELLVNGNEVESLHMRFRMAVHFPDLSMMGEHGFTKLMSSPGATEDAFESMLGAE